MFQAETAEPLPIDYRDYLPAEWTPVGQWQPVNIDGDEAVERLLFYKFDNGQVGAVIYDPRTDTQFITGHSIPLPNQPSVSLVPYRLLPSYWLDAGQGFIAAPHQAEQLEVLAVRRGTAAELGAVGVEGQADELVVRGGNSLISFFWWRDPLHGYGVSQVFAPGGLGNIRWEGRERETPIRQVDGLFPQHDRSLLCKRATFTRELLLGDRFPDSFRPAITYRSSPRRLGFCADSPPAQPFYPEAVVLAYLLAPEQMQHLVQADMRSRVAAIVGQFDRVEALTYYETLPVASSLDAVAAQLQMTVIADLVEAGGRWRRVSFLLSHQLPDVNGRTSDRWLIVLAIASL